MGLFRVFLLQSYKWMGWMGWVWDRNLCDILNYMIFRAHIYYSIFLCGSLGEVNLGSCASLDLTDNKQQYLLDAYNEDSYDDST